MCGITGIVAFNEVGRFNLTNLSSATLALQKRGPDDHGTYHDNLVGLGHRRLSVIDTSPMGHQPMQVPEGRYVITFNGEIYNYKTLRQELESKGVTFYSQTDTEVLLQLYTHEGKDCIHKLHGFFAFAIYDTVNKSVFIARDRLGIKPLLYYHDQDKFLFSSELKSLMQYSSGWQIDPNALNTYLQLSYTPTPLTMVEGVKKLAPGECILIADNQVTVEKYYNLPRHEPSEYLTDYEKNKNNLIKLLEESVQERLVADVPLGAFLSGGIDSSVITALASQHTSSLSTFSIGYKDSPYFDETQYANLVARHFKTNHTVFSLTQDDLYNHLQQIVEAIDEPFADSSAIPVYILSRETRRHVTVALSGDGADELFSGYNKHHGWIKMEENGLMAKAASALYPLAKALPQSRSGAFGNLIRQVVKFNKGKRMNPAERYWLWAAIASQSEVSSLLQPAYAADYTQRKEQINSWLTDMNTYRDFNDFLRTDTRLVLPNDMLHKVDLMSMANSLEVRTPFLDHRLVDFAFRLPPAHKIDSTIRKKILQDAFRHMLPAKLYKRPKKGFEVPLLDWLRNGLLSELDNHLFNKERLEEQKIFDSSSVIHLRKKLLSANPGDSHAKVWALYVFQKWHAENIATP